MFNQQFDITTLPVAPTLHWLEAFALNLRSTPSQKRRQRSQLSLSAYVSDVRLVAEWFKTRYAIEFTPDQLNQVNVEEYFAALANTVKPSTYNRRLASVRMLINWARSVDLLVHDPAAWVPFVDAVRKSPRDVAQDERIQLEAAAEAGESTLIGLRDSLIFFLMNDAGLRINEVVTLKLSDLHLDDGYIHVLGKGSKHREPKIGSRLVTKIRAWMDRKSDSVEGTLITDERGFAIDRGSAWRRFVMIAEQAGVRCTPHAMRHTYVLRYMDAYMKGDPWKMPAAIDAVCQQTGDRPEVILAYYTRARESDMRAAAEMM